jgi:hypothetical protein
MSGSAAQRWSVAVRQRRMLRTRSSRAQRSKLVAGCSSGGGGGGGALTGGPPPPLAPQR